MKKTLTANISGTVFHIEEDAYDTLQRYLGGIRGQFAGTDGRDEIMADIEARIAELLTERLDGRRQVVSLADVEHVMAIMGRPEDFAEGEVNEPDTQEQATQEARGRKRFFRDDDDKWVGGVLGGLGAYIGMDPLWLRVAMIVLVWASVGVLIPMYILLWILVPKAQSSADRLQMRGEAVTVENIKRVVEEGAERMKQGGERMAGEARDIGREWRRDASRRKGQVAGVIGKLVGVALIVTAFSLLLGLITGLIGGTFSIWNATWTSEDVGLLDLGGLLFNGRQHALWFGVGLFMLLAIPVLALFLAGFRLLLDTRAPKWLGWSLFLLWLAAWVPTIAVGVDLGREFHRENSVRTEVHLAQPTGHIIYLDAMNPADSSGGWSVRFDDHGLDVDLEGLHLENGTVFGAWARLSVERSPDSLFHLHVVREARGRTAKAALARAEGISYHYRQEGDVLFVSPVLRYPAEDKFRAQDAQFTLEVPLGKSIFFRKGSEAIIYDIKNVTNTWDHEMPGRTWTMTPDGLANPDAPRERRKKGEGEMEDATGREVAATVWRGPARKPVPRPTHANTPAAQVPAPHTELPSVLKLLGAIGR